MPESLGTVTRVVYLEEPEPGKIHIEFEAGAALKSGQQVKLNSTGKIVAAAAAEPIFNVIGVLIQDVTSGNRATVACRGYGVIIARAAGAIDPGPVQLAAYDTENNRAVYATVSGTDAEKLLKTVGHNLDDLGAAGEIKVVLL